MRLLIREDHDPKRGSALNLRLLQLLLVVAVTFGGSGGYPTPLRDTAVQLVAVAVLAWSLKQEGARTLISSDRLLAMAVAAVVALPALQLIPLPPALWRGLGGRELQWQVVESVGLQEGWRPISLYPHRTLSALVSLFPFVTAAYLSAGLPSYERRQLLLTVAIVAGASAMLGTAQLGNPELHPFEFTHLGFSTGFFASRNIQAIFLLLGGLAGTAWLARNLPRRQAIAASGILIACFGIGVFTTGSRAGLLLLAPTVLGCAVLLEAGRRFAAITSIVAAALLAIAIPFLHNNSVFSRSLDRFSELETVRPEIWDSTISAGLRHLPWGSGMGTFAPVYASLEDFGQVRTSYVNRAHNDFLELFLEAGPAGIIVLIFVLMFIAIRANHLLKTGRWNDRQHAVLVLFSTLLLLIHSTVDYPLRTPGILLVAGVFIGFLRRPSAPREFDGSPPHQWRQSHQTRPREHKEQGAGRGTQDDQAR